MNAAAPQTIRLFGKVAIEGGEDGNVPLARGKVSELLAYVATRFDEGVARDQAAAALWPDGDLHEARNRLNVTCFRLKELLGKNSPFHAERDTFRLCGDGLRCDVAEFRRLLRLATHAPDANAKTTLLIEALGWVQGVYLPGYDAPWVLYERQRVEQQTGSALAQTLATMGGGADGQMVVRGLLGAGAAIPIADALDPIFRGIPADESIDRRRGRRLGPLKPKPEDGRAFWDAAADYDPASNPNGAWTCGWCWELGAEFVPYRERGASLVDGDEVETMRTTSWEAPSAAYRSVYSTVEAAPPGRSLLTSGIKGQKATVRWTAREAGAYQIDVDFTRTPNQNGNEVFLMACGLVVATAIVRPERPAFAWSGIAHLERGGIIDAVVGGDTFSTGNSIEMGLSICPA